MNSYIVRRYSDIGKKVWASVIIVSVVAVSFGPAFPRIAFAADTGFAAASGTLAPNQWTNASNAFSSNNIYATSLANGNEQGYINFSFPALPSGAIITGIQVNVDAKSDDADCDLGVRLSWNGGSTYTSQITNSLSTSESTEVFGGSVNTWGRSWSSAELANGTFVVKIQAIDGDGAGQNNSNDCRHASDLVYADIVQAKVFYTAPQLVVDSINGMPPNIANCIAGTLHIIGHGTRGSNGGPYSLDIGYAGATTTVSVGSGADGAFNFDVTVSPPASGSSNNLTLNVYHGSPSGNDSHFVTIQQCVAAPTQGVVTVKKNVINDNAGTSAAAAFTLHLGSNTFAGSQTGTQFVLAAGAYTVSEDAVAGYTQSSLICIGDDASNTTDGTVVVVAQKNYTCTVTNDDNAPTIGALVVVKNVVTTGGGTAVPASFNIHVKNNGVDIGGSPAAGSSVGTVYALNAGNYTVSEDPDVHYTGDFSACGSNGLVTVAANATTTCTITNTFHNAAPVAQNGSLTTDEDVAASSNLVANDSDLDTLIYTILTNPVSGTLSGFNSATGAFTYTPDANFNGSDSFTFGAFDGVANSNVGAVSITVNPTNDAPTALDDSYSTNEDAPLPITAPGILSNDSDIDVNSLTAVLVTNVANGILALNSDGSFDYTPNANFAGTDTFTYKANDGTVDSNIATVSISVSNTNDAPVGVHDTYSTNEDESLVVLAAGVLGNDTDADGDSLFAVMGGNPAHGTVSLNSDGSFTYTPNANFVGTDTFTYQAHDSTDVSAETVVTITVTAVNDAPVANNASIATEQNTATSSALVGSDVDNNILTFATTTSPSHGVLSVFNPATGVFTYVPFTNYSGTDSFSFVVNDGSVDSNIATITISVAQLFENTLQLCSDGIDNDNDETIDLADSDCAVFAPTLTVIKTVINDNNGTSTASDFTLNVQDTSEFSQTFAGSATGTVLTVHVGSFTVSEASAAGYSGTISGDCAANGQVTLAIGDNKVCTITNNDNAPQTETPSTENGGGNGGGGGGPIGNGPPVGSFGGGNGPIAGSVLGASTTTLPELPANCTALLNTYMRINKKNNDVQEVKKLQEFLNKEVGAALPITGFFGKSTDAAVRKFQKDHTPQVLTPWGITDPTGYVYKTTQRWVNLTHCSSLSIPMPILN